MRKGLFSMSALLIAVAAILAFIALVGWVLFKGGAF